MTEYGRGPGSAPWHPEDPLYGDQGWTGHQAPDGRNTAHGTQQAQQPQQGYEAVQGDPYQQGYANQQYAAGQPHDGHSYGEQQYGAVPQHEQQQYQQQHEQQQVQHQQQAQGHQAQQPQQGRQHAQQPQQQYGDGSQQDPYQQQYTEHQYAAGGWDAAQQTGLAYDPAQSAPYQAETPDLYGTPDAYPPPEPPARRPAEPEPAAEGEHDWEAEPEAEKHPFFTGDDGSGDADPEPGGSRRSGGDGRDGRGGRTKKQKKGRNGIACLVVAVVLVGGLGGVSYFGYQFWQGKFGEAPDYSGAGSGTVQVEIPPHSAGFAIGQVLKKAGVVKSVDAFVSAQGNNPQGKSIQAGVYTLKKEMSAASAVKLMLSPASRSALIIPEGKRNAWVYEQIDTRLGLESGSTKKVAQEQAKDLGLPDWAKGRPNLKDPLEGFLFPASYPVAKGTKPEKVLRKMVARANQEYGRIDLEAEARKLKLDGPWQLITAASLVQAEGKTDDDFRKMAEVIYNRLKPDNTETNRKIQFDSAFNYLQGQSEIKISESEIKSNPDLYNTYYHEGLTPGPIGNPGIEALEAALSPTSDGWMYFVATDGMNKTEFAKTHDEFLELKEKFNESGVG
ncbi:endolytic transglycosylase MltG [Streptomyces sp. NPDC020141]|uniref:endolytic transglycosylase MltG n=1 Tax=Streptomyces sp. NPDC020141 TaxID=3365065 RepID=UPI00378B90F3